MGSKGIVRAVTVVSIVASLCVYAVMGVSGYTSAISFFESAMGALQTPSRQMTGDPSTGFTLTLSITARNPGLLEVGATLNLKLLTVDREVIAEGVGSKRIPPGSSDQLVVILHISADKAATLTDPNAIMFSILLECRTLFDLVGISASVEMTGGGSPPGP